MNRRSGFAWLFFVVPAFFVLGLWPAAQAQSARPTVAQGWAILSATQGVDFSPYMQQLLARVHQNWYKSMPQQAMLGEKGKVSVVFAILPDGSLSPEGPALETSSHHKPLDQAALLAVRDSAPFSPLPHEFRGKLLKLRISFFYSTRPE
jgi:TonB family protein